MRNRRIIDIINEMVMGKTVMHFSGGLHARPSMALTKIAKGFSSDIEFSKSENGPWVNLKSIVATMGAKISEGTTVYIRANGPDEKAALEAIKHYIDNNK